LTGLKKKKFDLLVIRGATSAEIILKKFFQKASEKGIEIDQHIFEALKEYKEKLEKILENFLYKEKLLLIFEDFDENQTTEGEIINARLKELITFLKDSLKDKNSRMIFCSCYDIPKFPSIEIKPFTWKEFQEMISNTVSLKRLDKKSLKSLHFEMGGYPRAIDLLDKIALREFGASTFIWTKLRSKVVNLAERILHKEDENADFSYLLVETLIGFLTPKQHEILDALSIYKGGVTKDMVSAQHVEITPALRKKLVETGLVYYSGKTGEYYVTRLTAQKVLVRMEEGERKKKHLAAAKYLKSLDENEPAARYHFIEAGAIDDAFAMTTRMDQYLCKTGFPQLAFDLIADMEKYEPELNEVDQILLHNRLSVFLSLFGKLDEAIEHTGKALKLNRASDDTAGILLNLSQMGLLYEAKGKDEEALENYSNALEAAEKIKDKGAIALMLDKTGIIQKRLGHYDDAFNSFQRLLKINRENDDQKAISYNLEQLGRIHDEQTKFDEALNYYKKSLEIKEAIGEQQGAAELIHQMGNVNFVKGNLDEALALYQRSLSIKEIIGDIKGSGYSQGQIGLILHRKGLIDDALVQYENSVKNFEKADEQKGIAAGNHQIGRIFESKGDIDKAMTYYEKAVETREKTGDVLGAAITYGQLGMLYFNKEEYETAMRFSTKAYAIFSTYGSANIEIVRKNMLRIKQKLPLETFNNILKEFNINTEPASKKENVE
jgi:tetratricopeptide (TPR) repeat protein